MPHTSTAGPPTKPGLSTLGAAGVCVAAAAAFHLAFLHQSLSPLIAVYLYCLLRLAWAATWRQALLFGLGAGMLVFAPRLAFFWAIFGPAAIDFWLLLSLFTVTFVVLVRAVRVRYGDVAAAWLSPFAWTGLEYFRSEMYYTRFSWLSAGYAFADSPLSLHLDWFGVYGIAFATMALCAVVIALRRPWVYGLAAASVLASCPFVGGLLSIRHNWTTPSAAGRSPYVLGIQMEFPDADETLSALDEAVGANPGVDIIVLSEYTFDGPVPQAVCDWCRRHARYLIAGGKDRVAGSDAFYNTAFVIGPDGEVAFSQAKSVPIQFFKDGLPAREQKAWNSPWGPIGVCICYDLSYTKVTDRLIDLGARAIIVPTMDVEAWGEAQHRLHSRIASVRAAEYRVPVFRVCSSGISQAVDQTGQVQSRAPYGGQHCRISSLVELPMAQTARMPSDRWLGPACALACAVLAAWLTIVGAAATLPRRRA